MLLLQQHLPPSFDYAALHVAVLLLLRHLPSLTTHTKHPPPLSFISFDAHQARRHRRPLLLRVPSATHKQAAIVVVSSPSFITVFVNTTPRENNTKLDS